MGVLDTGITKKINAASLVSAWEQAASIMETAHKDLDRAQEILDAAFGHDAYMHTIPQDNRGLEGMRKDNKKRAWRQIVALLEIRKVMSVKRIEELDKNIEHGDMPEITLDNILQISRGLVENAGEFAAEAVIEVFDFLRPGAGEFNKYKTNAKNARFELGKKVIIVRALEWRYGGGYHVSYWRSDNIRAVDRVFHLADGAGQMKGYEGPLIDAIQTSTAETGYAGETEYFRFKCYGNGNLHLEFKRPDLVTKLNAAAGAGGNKLRGK